MCSHSRRPSTRLCDHESDTAPHIRNNVQDTAPAESTARVRGQREGRGAEAGAHAEQSGCRSCPARRETASNRASLPSGTTGPPAPASTRCRARGAVGRTPARSRPPNSTAASRNGARTARGPASTAAAPACRRCPDQDSSRRRDPRPVGVIASPRRRAPACLPAGTRPSEGPASLQVEERAVPSTSSATRAPPGRRCGQTRANSMAMLRTCAGCHARTCRLASRRLSSPAARAAPCRDGVASAPAVPWGYTLRQCRRRPRGAAGPCCGGGRARSRPTRTG
jgi:hypothetical protein